MHELGPEPNFNESMYFNVFDADRRTGGFFRLGNRPNEGSGEMTTCVYLPDGLEPSSSSTSHLTWLSARRIQFQSSRAVHCGPDLPRNRADVRGRAGRSDRSSG
jgi:hypothetical protein